MLFPPDHLEVESFTNMPISISTPYIKQYELRLDQQDNFFKATRSVYACRGLYKLPCPYPGLTWQQKDRDTHMV